MQKLYAPNDAIAEGLKLLPAAMNSRKARVLMYAIALQESRFTHRRQIGGPARGFWQFERGGGVRGVLSHPASSKHAGKVCAARNVKPTPIDVYPELEHDDVLAAAFARLLLFTDPSALPEIGDVQGSWDYYIRNWRPGRPHPKTWAPLYAQAVRDCK